MARQPQYARRSTHRNKVVVGVNDPQAFQLSLNDSNADYTGAKIRQDPLILPYFGRTGVLCIPHWWRARFVRCMDIFKSIFKRVIICMDIFAAFLFRGDQLRFANRLCQACWCRCRHWVTGTGAAAPKWLTKREYAFVNFSRSCVSALQGGCYYAPSLSLPVLQAVQVACRNNYLFQDHFFYNCAFLHCRCCPM